MKRSLKENSLSIVFLALFLLTVVGQVVTGLDAYNQDQKDHDQEQVGMADYLTTGHFIEAIFENWESEFLQMGAFVILTVSLRQKGSPESKQIDGEQEVDREPDPKRKNAPWPVKRGGVWLKLYENSLGLALFALFFVSLALHAVGGSMNYSEEQKEHGGEAVSPVQYLGTSQFWFESFQNWQSEFMSVGALVVLGIFLRQKGSNESKPVDAPHDATGED